MRLNMQVDLEKIKKLPPDVRKDFMKMALKLNEKKKISKVNSDFCLLQNICGQNLLKVDITKLFQKNLTKWQKAN